MVVKVKLLLRGLAVQRTLLIIEAQEPTKSHVWLAPVQRRRVLNGKRQWNGVHIPRNCVLIWLQEILAGLLPTSRRSGRAGRSEEHGSSTCSVVTCKQARVRLSKATYRAGLVATVSMVFLLLDMGLQVFDNTRLLATNSYAAYNTSNREFVMV